jgi:predicted secreted protein
MADTLLIQAHPGDIDVPVAESPTTGYRWHLAPPPHGVTPIGDSFAPEAAGMAGGGGTRTFRFHVAAPGTYELRLELKRAWESKHGHKPARELIVELVVSPH